MLPGQTYDSSESESEDVEDFTQQRRGHDPRGHGRGHASIKEEADEDEDEEELVRRRMEREQEYEGRRFQEEDESSKAPDMSDPRIRRLMMAKQGG